MASVNNDLTPKQPKILLVDDREDNLLSIEAILEPDGYQFFRAYSGQQALKILLNEFDFAMILMDVKMPVLNGFETATIIYEREKLSHIPIIFITANNYGDENIFKGYKAGGIDYIFKPINPEVLRAKVAVFMDLYRKNTLLHEQEQALAAANKQLEKEIDELKASARSMKEHNAKLQKEIFALESLVVSSPLLFNNTEFEQTDLTKLFLSFVDEMYDQGNEKTPTVLIEPLPILRVNHLLMRQLFQNLIRNAIIDSNDTKPVIKFWSEIGGLRETSISKKSGNVQHHNIIIENKNVGNNGSVAATAEQPPMNGPPMEIGNSFALCQKIMEKHDGFIFVENKSNDETVYILSFPMAP